ncbi:MAG: transcriptional regulator [Ferruginibacter sp.]|nr:transcriptional regulator [Ferruginibacter sp.]
MKQRILLIEDNDEIRENTAEILELSNYDVETAVNGKQGVEKALAQRPDLIICDIMMPVLDGYGVLHLLHKHEELSTVPFIFLTAKSERADLRRGMEMGADDYISKPFTDIELLNAIESRLKKQAAGKKAAEAEATDDTASANPFGSLEHITEDREQNNYSKKQLIYREGNHPKKLFFLKKGKVRTFISNDDGKVLTTTLFGDGDFFGYTALIEGSGYKDTAEAIEESEVIEIPADEFEHILWHDPAATKRFIRMLSHNIVEREQQLLNIAYNSLRKKVATALMQLLTKYREEGPASFSINFSREDLANVAGTATESLIRTLSDFKAEQLIDIHGSRITVLNEKKLAGMLN